MFLFTGIPAYSAPNLLYPTAFNSYPKTVLLSVNQIIATAVIANNIPRFIYEPPNILESQSAFNVAPCASFADSVSVVPFKYCGTM